MKSARGPRHAILTSATVGLSAASPLLSAADSAADAGRCFLRHGDRWSIQGDSITANGGYVRLVRRVLNLWESRY